ncbi:hypothetical protein ABK040_009787 [Willaertia magna]
MSIASSCCSSSNNKTTEYIIGEERENDDTMKVVDMSSFQDISNTIAKSDKIDIVVKLLMLGDSGVGKTSIVSRWVYQEFDFSQLSTIGIDFQVKFIEFEKKRFKVQIWDTAGQERYRSITSSYYRGTDGVILVYDLTSKESLNNLELWMNSLLENNNQQSNNNKPLRGIIIGNKCDAEHSEVIISKAEKLAKELGYEHFICSAKNNINLEKPFQSIFGSVADSFIRNSNKIEVTNNVPKKK